VLLNCLLKSLAAGLPWPRVPLSSYGNGGTGTSQCSACHGDLRKDKALDHCTRSRDARASTQACLCQATPSRAGNATSYSTSVAPSGAVIVNVYNNNNNNNNNAGAHVSISLLLL